MSNLKRILSIDGGGIRGIIPGQIIVEIEREFGVIVSDYFDMVVGTSTGGILTCAYLVPESQGSTNSKFSAQEVVNLYLENGEDIFDIPFFHKIRSAGGITDEKYPEDGLEDALDEYFGKLWLDELLKPCLVTSYDITNRKGHFFRQHVAETNDEYNFKVKDVARATSAAPTYFECARIFNKNTTGFNLIDGGVFVNNPALVAYAEGRSFFSIGTVEATAKDMKILSLGTGFTKKKYRYSRAKNYGKAQWIQPVIDIMMSGASEVADYQLEKIYNTTDQPDQYLRIDEFLNPKETGIDPDMDCATPENMERLRKFGTELFNTCKDDIANWLNL